MKYEIDFDERLRSDYFQSLYSSFDQCERTFNNKDLPRNLANVMVFVEKLRSLKLFGCEVRCGTYNDKNGGFVNYTRIGYARINGYEFIRNGRFYPKTLNEALTELTYSREE